jgi:hypothetical protein
MKSAALCKGRRESKARTKDKPSVPAPQAAAACAACGRIEPLELVPDWLGTGAPAELCLDCRTVRVLDRAVRGSRARDDRQRHLPLERRP